MTLRRTMPICAMLGLAAAARAGVHITLSAEPNLAQYHPNQTINVDVYAQLTPGTPSIPGPGGTTSLVRVRMLQFDLADTSPEILAGLSPVGHHATQETQFFPGPIPFWDFGIVFACSEDELLCGMNYFVDGAISPPSDTVFNTTFTGTTTSGANMMVLNQMAPRRVGEFNLTLPSAPGAYILNLINRDTTDPENAGAQLWWGFGSQADPFDPTSPLRATDFTGGTYVIMIPEPATLVLLGLGGLGAVFGRRSAC